ncbi:MAG TPA: hypothetical protein VFV36_10295 [Candidatus Methylomirabilis sp.]|nr:hypothetical protein [Candidatus Methylomirabilis sp.]
MTAESYPRPRWRGPAAQLNSQLDFQGVQRTLRVDLHEEIEVWRAEDLRALLEQLRG